VETVAQPVQKWAWAKRAMACRTEVGRAIGGLEQHRAALMEALRKEELFAIGTEEMTLAPHPLRYGLLKLPLTTGSIHTW